MLANRHTSTNAITDTPGCLRDYHGHCNYPGNGRQSVENVDPNIPAKRKTAKRLRRIIVSSVIGILGLCVQCVCVCVGGGGGGKGDVQE